ncbi:hypothetical protein IWQ61_003231 [Dispira simplex]|nr:hypothetical protein IWQ61_003231 [Dispira simplex]
MLTTTTHHQLKTPKGETLVIRDACSSDERNLPLEWEKVLQWDPCFHDFAVHVKVSTNRILLGLVNDRIVSCLVVHVFDNQTVFFGPYMVLEPSDRGKGYGHALMQYMFHVYRDCAIGCNGLVDKVPYYEKYGMQSHYAVQRLRGAFPSSWAHLAARHQSQYRIVEDIDQVLDIMIEMDYVATGVRRCEFWQHWLTQTERITLALCSGEQESDQCYVAIGCLAPLVQPGMYRLAPLFAMDRMSALALSLELMQRVVDTEPINESSGSMAALQFDISCEMGNTDAVEIYQDSFQWSSVMQAVRLWKGDKPTTQHPCRLYGVAGVECD